MCAWRGTRNSSTANVLKRAEACGAYLHANAQREQTLYCIDALRDKLEDATQLLAEACLLGPDLEAPGAMDEVREGMELAFLDATQVRRFFVGGVLRLLDGVGAASESRESRRRRPAQDARVRENIHAAAYGSSPLGAPLLCPPSQLHTLSPKTLADFRAL